ncbi:MAG TPA: hypothetical protein VJ553_04105 [Candidatus Paceibacterota bacterium]|nr:hypothetical protein [Candidatus Paceibacterota bacterium]
MSVSCNGWTVDLSSVDGLSLAEIADICLFAEAGAQAIRLLQRNGTPDALCSKLAAQALVVLRRVPAPEACESAFSKLVAGERPEGDLREVRSVMERMSEVLSDELERCTKRFNQLLGVRDL